MINISFKNKIKNLTINHYRKCKIYKKIVKEIGFNKKEKDISNFPFIPINLFKTLELSSVPKNKIVKVLNSSGTTGSIRSKIFLDQNNSNNQRKVLKELVQNLIGKERLPMLIIDQNPNLKKKLSIEAREAGIFGFSLFGKNHEYLLSNEYQIDYKILNSFLSKFGNNQFLIFGFTSNVYDYLIKKCNLKKIKKNFQNGILIHGGGWKKMVSKKLNNEVFRLQLYKKLKLKNIYNYYGLVEQTGSIFFECQKCNLFYTTDYSDIIIRNKELKVLTKGRGMIQLLSTLPTSYPGHNILTEDEGEIIKNSCVCGKKGKQFKIYGRIEKSEIRGCSDT